MQQAVTHNKQHATSYQLCSAAALRAAIEVGMQLTIIF